MTEKIFKSITEQIELLKSKGLIIIDEADTASKLSDFGYYENYQRVQNNFQE